MLTEKDIYDYLQSLLPGFQFCEAFLSSAPPRGNFAVMSILNITDIGWGVSEIVDNEEHTQLKNVTVQIDFYGDKAGDFSRLARQTIIKKMARAPSFSPLDLKNVGDIRNLSFWQENQEYGRRYAFDVEAFFCDTITEPVGVLLQDVKIRGHRFGGR